jgi:hypothetical protein
MKSGKETSAVEAKRKKNVNYDKRLIKKVVEAVEADVPRSELCSLYGMNIKTLTLWMQKYGSPAYHAAKKKVWKDSQRRSVLRTIDSGMSLKEAQVAFGVHPVTIKSWIRRFVNNDDLAGSNPVVMPKEPTDAVTSDEVRALQKALAEAELKIAGLNTLIDIAEDQLKIDIRKKSGAKRSSK